MHLSAVCLVLLVMDLTLAHQSAQVFSSNVQLESLLRHEQHLAELMLDLAKEELKTTSGETTHSSDVIENLRKVEHLGRFHLQKSQDALKDIEGYLGNPVKSFLMIKRLSVDWQKRFKPLQSKLQKSGLLKDILKASKHLPSDDDLKGAVFSINRLQDFYLFNFSDIAKGELAGVESPRLSLDDCVTLGNISLENHDFWHTVMWMTIALDKISSQDFLTEGDDIDGDLKMTTAEVNSESIRLLDFLSMSYYYLGNVTKVIPLLDRILEIEPDNVKALNNKNVLLNMLEDPEKLQKHTSNTMNTLPEFNINRHGYVNYKEFLNYTSLCRGENSNSDPSKNRHLVCRMTHNNNPRLVLQPTKEEIVNLSPRIIVYHDVVTDHEIDTIKAISSHRIDTEEEDKHLKHYITKNVRIVKNTWLYTDTNPAVVEKIDTRIGDITGLSLESAEPLQVANYGIGGHYVPHCDGKCDMQNPNTKKVEGDRDRIATFMIYLSDVQEGGATVFIKEGLGVKPRKGSAAFWYNVHRSGSPDLQTRHGACPVLLGNKWVANKWFHERGQEFTRPCGLSPSE